MADEVQLEITSEHVGRDEKEIVHDSDRDRYAKIRIARQKAGVAQINDNQTGEIRNPLRGIPRDQLFEEVERFSREHDLTDIQELIWKGALIAQNPGGFNDLKELNDTEKGWIRDEVRHKWRQPKILYFTIICNSIAATIQGWDQTGSNGANLSWPAAFGIPYETEIIGPSPNVCAADGDVCAQRAWLVGAINSAPYLCIFVFASFLSDPINHRFGRRSAIFMAAICSLLAPIGSAFTQTWPQLLICRLLLGVGMGIKESTVPIYSAELAPTPIRGALVMSWQTWTAAGLLLGFSANLAVKDVGDIAWRLQLGSAFIPAIPLLIGIYFCPESPRWLMSKGRYRDAYDALCKFRNSKLQAAKELYYVHAQLQEEKLFIEREGLARNGGLITRFIELFTISRLRRSTQAAGIVMIGQQMCGINIIAFYSSSLFVQANATTTQALLGSWGFGLLNFIFAWPAFWLIDKIGRRSLLLLTIPNMCWTLLAAGLCSLIPTKSSAHLGLVAFFIFLFSIFYSPGLGPVPFAYSAEIFPLSHREIGMAWAVATNNFYATIISLTVPRQLQAFKATGVFGFYAAMNVVAFLLIFLFLPETKQRSLEELDYVFGVPTRRHMNYQVKEALPYWFNKQILRRKGLKLHPLYNFDQVEVGPSQLAE